MWTRMAVTENRMCLQLSISTEIFGNQTLLSMKNCERWLSPMTCIQASRPRENFWVLSTNDDCHFRPNGHILSEGWVFTTKRIDTPCTMSDSSNSSSIEKGEIEENPPPATLSTPNKLLTRFQVLVTYLTVWLKTVYWSVYFWKVLSAPQLMMLYSSAKFQNLQI